MQKTNQFTFAPLRFNPLLGAMLFLLVACSGPITPLLRDPAEAANTQALSAPTPTAPVEFQPGTVSLALETITEDLDSPIFVTHAGDDSGRIFVVEKAGQIRIVADSALVETPFLDITDRVRSSANEQGLLGLAFAPNYTESGFFFVNYTDDDGNTVVARFQVITDNADQADPASEFAVLQIEQPASNHNGGMIAFGPDGYLYIGMGDGGGSGDRYGHGQNPETLLGKMLRIDVTSDPAQPYVIPADNPWVAQDWNGVDVRDEIWAVGLRNPWRFSFDRTTGDLWIGDVGQNQFEEIHYTPADNPGGINYGWPILEASDCYSNGENCDKAGLELPVAEYSHSGHCSVTGGYVYRGEQFPALQGIYLYGDYCSGTIWGSWFADGWQSAELLDSDVSLSSFGEDEASELYVTNLSTGVLSRLVLE
jgi:glucose/arabinose dehydrogenase